MELALNAGFGDPIQHELALIASLGFTVVRQDLFAHGDGAPIETLVGEFTGQTVRPLFLLAGGKMEHDDGAERIEPHELAARATRLVAAANACGLVSYAVEVGNEPDIAHDGYASRPQDFAEAVRQSHEALRAAGFDGPVISGGVSNLNERGLDYLKRALAVGTVPADVIAGFHRYPEKARGALAPHDGFTSRDDEWNALTAISGRPRAGVYRIWLSHRAREDRRIHHEDTHRPASGRQRDVGYPVLHRACRHCRRRVSAERRSGSEPDGAPLRHPPYEWRAQASCHRHPARIRSADRLTHLRPPSAVRRR